MQTDELFAKDGALARALGDDYESRAEQVRMGRAVLKAMEARSHLLVEAGTGVGKSFAYLVPAILRATRHHETVVVATNTISLQEQLIQKDIPLLARALGVELPVQGVSVRVEGETLEEAIGRATEGEAVTRPRALKAVLVKGRGNYVSIRRLKLASSRQDRLWSDPAARRSLHAIEDWAMETTDGSLSSLPPLERPGVWDKVQSDSGNCMGRRCRNYQQCFYQNARAEMDGANLLVCNHALFFSDLALRGQEVGFLPRYQHVILDEAHNVEDVASDHFGAQLSEGRVMHLLTTLYQSRGNKGFLPQLLLMSGASDAVEKAIRLVEQAAAASRVFFEELIALCRGGSVNPFEAGEEAGVRRGPENSRRLREPGMVGNVITPVMRELSLRLKSLKEQAKNEEDKFELNSYAQRSETIASDAEVLVGQKMAGCAYWVEVSGVDDAGYAVDRRGPKVTLACSPVEVREILKERLFSREQSVVLTSATLATRTAGEEESLEVAETAFSHVMARLGCEGADTLQLGSPFNYRDQVEFIVDRSVDSKSAKGKWGGRGGGEGSGDSWEAGTRRRSYGEQLADRILHHVKETDGGAFVLFTSFATLNSVASQLAGPLAELGMPLLAQGRDGPRSLILERFRENERSVLLGAASFWQGVDVRGRGLRNVIITKLPFDPPDRPLTQARCEQIEARGGDAFSEDSLPRAVIKFKQGFGRLIRSATDHGRVVVLDGRILTARYGRVFLKALPEGVEAKMEG